MQRLHHICFDTVSDKYTFIQLAAINKSELLGSIAKTFGREFNLTKKYTTTNGSNPGTIFNENFEESQIQFGNYYFKKFFQMIIPVSNGEQIEKPLSILEGFEKNFDSSDTKGREYVERFLTEVLSFFPMRTKLELIHLVKTAHEITALDSSLDKHLTYNTLCIELIDVLCKSILKRNFPKVLHKELEDDHNGLYLQIDNLADVEELSNIQEFENTFERWSMSECGNLPPHGKIGTTYPFFLHSPESYIKVFYELDKSMVRNKDPLPSEVAFIKAFRKALNALV